MKKIALMCLFVSTLPADSVFRDASRDGVREKGILVAEGSFTMEHLVELARAELAQTPNAHLIKLTILGPKGGVSPPKAGPYGFESWLRLYDTVPVPVEMAEMIAIGDNAALLIRDQVGRLSERTIAGHNALRVTVGGDDFQIVHVALGRAIAYDADLRFFLTTPSPLGPAAGKEILRKLQSAVPGFEVSVAVQNKAWFVADGDYPILNAFVDNPAPPTKDEFMDMKTLFCWDTDGALACELRSSR